MANAYTVRVISITSDGTNLFLEVQLDTGIQTLPIIRPTFEVGTTFAQIQSYLQTIANNQPTLASDLPALVGAVIRGV